MLGRCGMQDELTIDRLLLKMQEVEASDLHIKVGSPPVLRIASQLHEINVPPLTNEAARAMLMQIVPKHLQGQVQQRGGGDFCHSPAPGQRYRCSCSHDDGGPHTTSRRVNPKIHSFEALRTP